MSEQSKGLQWFTSLPGILTGVAAVITAVVGMIGALQLLGVFDRGDPSESGAGSESARVVTPSQGVSNTEPQPSTLESEPGGEPLAEGRIMMDSGDFAYVDLETGVVDAITFEALQVQIRSDHVVLDRQGNGYFVAVDTSSDKELCVEALTTNRVAQLELHTQDVGTRWCTVGDDQIAWIEIVEVGYPSPRRFVFDYVVWDP